MKISVLRLRNLTTGILHTKVEDIYTDLENITGETGLMTHMLPRVLNAITPFLKKHITDPIFWNNTFCPELTGEIEIPTPTVEERKIMFNIFKSLPNPLESKETIVAIKGEKNGK